MLKDHPFFPTVPVTDLERAKQFYGEVLGLTEVPYPSPEQGVLFEGAQGSKVYLYQRGPSKADHTLFAFTVPDIEEAVRELRDKGVSFLEYDTETIKTVDGIATWGQTKAAWFKDSEGNVIGIDQHSDQA